MVRVHGDAISVGDGFISRKLLLLLHPAVHVGVGGFESPPSQGLRCPLGRPGTLRTVRSTWGLMRGHVGFSRGPIGVPRFVYAQQRTCAEAVVEGRLGRRMSPAQSQVDGLVFELVHVGPAGRALALLSLSFPGFKGRARVDSEVGVEECRQVTGVLPD